MILCSVSNGIRGLEPTSKIRDSGIYLTGVTEAKFLMEVRDGRVDQVCVNNMIV